MTNDQVRWKINALVKKYKEVVDNNSLSERVRMDFEYFEQMDEILGPPQRAIAGQTASSKLTSKTSNPCTSTSLESSSSCERKSSCASSSISNSPLMVKPKRKRPCHGTGSKIASTKVELEKQWLHHLQKKKSVITLKIKDMQLLPGLRKRL